MHERAHEPGPAPAPAPAGPVASPPAAGVLSALTPDAVLSLQRTAGNVAVQRAILARDLASDYDDAVKVPDWKKAAELLNGFSRDDISARLKARTVAQVRELHKEAVANPKVGPQSQLALMTPNLLSDFADKFRDAAEQIRLSAEGLKLVAEAEAAGAKFGGYAEDGPGKDTWPYTSGNSVYVPKARTDKFVAMSDFLFELNNAIRAPAFAALDKQAGAGTIEAKQYAHDVVAQEVDGMLRLGKVWFESKKALGSGKGLDKYDADFFLSQYDAFVKGTKSREDIITAVLKSTYNTGVDAGKTAEQYYMEQYAKMAPKKDAGVK
jgi:hypothetical protein